MEELGSSFGQVSLCFEELVLAFRQASVGGFEIPKELTDKVFKNLLACAQSRDAFANRHPLGRRAR